LKNRIVNMLQRISVFMRLFLKMKLWHKNKLRNVF